LLNDFEILFFSQTARVATLAACAESLMAWSIFGN